MQQVHGMGSDARGQRFASMQLQPLPEHTVHEQVISTEPERGISSQGSILCSSIVLFKAVSIFCSARSIRLPAPADSLFRLLILKKID